MLIQLTYFKPWSGKFYSTGELETTKRHLYEIVEEIHALALARTLPGLAPGAGPFVIHALAEDLPPMVIGLDEAATYVMGLRGQPPRGFECAPAALGLAYQATLFGGGPAPTPAPLARADLENMFQLAPGAEEPG